MDDSRFRFQDGCLLNSELTTIHAYAFGSRQLRLTVKPTVSSITAYCFEKAYNLEEVFLGGSDVDYIGYCAFRGCRNLRTIELPPRLENIGKDAFSDCPSLACGSFLFIEESNISSQRELLRKQGIDEILLHPCASIYFTANLNSASSAWSLLVAQLVTSDDSNAGTA